jgi:hypothetical protein
MPFASYADLQTSVGRWLKRTNLNDQIPDFISLAEARLNRRLSVRQMRTWLTVTPSTNFVTLPGDYNRAIRVMYGDQRLDFTSENIADPMMTEGGQWNQFTIAGNKLWLLTQIDGTTKLTLHYYQQIEPLSDSNTSNWLLEDGPDLYLYAALLEAEVFIKNDDRIAVWTAALERAMADIESNDDAGQFAGSSLAMKRA